MTMKFWFALGPAALLVVPVAQATTGINYPLQIDPAIATNIDEIDYSATGLNLGQLGFLFFNFGQTADTGAVDVGQNAANSLPSWISVDFDSGSSGYSFGTQTFSQGGVSDWSRIILPDGTSGLSGALIDPEADNNSNNSINSDTGLLVGAGAPSSFRVSFVTDNTNNEHNSVNRLRARESVSGEDVRLENLTYNAIPDVYTFTYEGVVAGDRIALQLHSGVAGIDPSISGIMFDVIPEPSSIALLGLAMGLACLRRR